MNALELLNEVERLIRQVAGASLEDSAIPVTVVIQADDDPSDERSARLVELRLDDTRLVLVVHDHDPEFE